MDILADLSLMVEEEPAPRKERKGTKWYQRHAPGWAPEADDVTLAPRALASCNCHQVPSVVYAPVVYTDPALDGARLYYPGFGVLWGYRGTFQGHDSLHYEVEALDRVDGCGIALGSVWAAEAGKFRRVA